jgi:hypothetical protein
MHALMLITNIYIEVFVRVLLFFPCFTYTNCWVPKLVIMITFFQCSNKSRVMVFAGKESNSSRAAVIISVPTVASVLLIICICTYIFHLRVSKQRENNESKLEIGLSFLVSKDIISISKKKCHIQTICVVMVYVLLYVLSDNCKDMSLLCNFQNKTNNITLEDNFLLHLEFGRMDFKSQYC